MVIFQIIAWSVCIANVFLELTKNKKVNEKVLLWLILSFAVIKV